MQIKMVYEIQEERVKDLLTSAFEGGSNSWYWIERYNYPEGKPKTSYQFPHVELPLVKGGSLIITDKECQDTKAYTLDLTACERGLQVMAGKYPALFGDFLEENDDAVTGDVFLQCALFGEIQYS